MVDELVRIEKKVHARSGEIIPLQNTISFQPLPIKEKVNYVDYLKKRESHKKVFYIFFVIPLVLIVLLNSGITGLAITDEKTTNFIEILLMLFLLLVVIVFVIKNISNKKINKRLKEHSRIIEKRL